MNVRILTSSLLLSATLAVAQTSTPPAAPAQLPDAPGAKPAGPPAPVPTGATAVLDTTMGRIVCRFFADQSPLATANFIGLAEGTKTWTDPITQQKVNGKPFYNGTTFHRVIPGFMVQGGDRIGDGSGDAGYFFDNEDTPGLLFDVPGRLAMANAGRNTNGTQFFITELPVAQLNGGYTIFGQCDDNAVAIVTAIARVERNAQDRPTTPVVINKVTIVREGKPMPPLPAVPQNIVPPGKSPMSLPPGPPPH